MKTNTPRYRVFLKDRPLPDGSKPVIIRISFHGTIEKSLGFSVKQQDWDADKQRVRTKATNAKTFNSAIESFIASYENERIKLDLQGTPYTATTINQMVEQSKQPRPSEMTFSEATNRFFDIHNSSARTRELYSLYQKRVEEAFGKNVKARQVDVPFMTRLISYLRSCGRSDFSIYGCIAYVSAIIHCANEQGFIKTDTSIFARFRKQHKRPRKNERVIASEAQIGTMMKWLLNRLYFNGEEIATWQGVPELLPRPGINKLLATPTTPEFAVAYALLSYYLGGMAPCDIAKLKVSDLRINDGRLVLVGTRRKTNVQYFIARTYSDKMKALLNPFIQGKTDDELLTPAISHYKHLNNFETACRRHLQEAVRIINEELKKNMLGDATANIPDAQEHYNEKEAILLPEGLTLYSMRHSYATTYIRKSNNVGALAASMGRSVAGIGTYCKELTEEQEMMASMDLIG